MARANGSTLSPLMPSWPQTLTNRQCSVENLRRRVAGLEPLAPPEGDSTTVYTGAPELDTPKDQEFASRDGHVDAKVVDDHDDDDEVEDDNENDDESITDKSTGEPSLDDSSFVPEQCLFCSQSSKTLDDNIEHMQKVHGLFIPDRDRLIISLEALLRYLHLVVFDYNECLFCHSQRHSAEGARQHMLGKGHCKFDITSEDSEFLDFYDFTSGSQESGGDDRDDSSETELSDTNRNPRSTSSARNLSSVDGGSARLPSGKLLSSRSAANTKRRRRLDLGALASPNASKPAISSTPNTRGPGGSDSGATETAKTALTRSEKRENAITQQLANLSLRDRSALAHLPASEQRAVVARQQKETASTTRAERRYRSRVEMLGNKTLMTTFVMDVPGRKNG